MDFSKRWQGIGQDAPQRPIAQAIFKTDPQAPANVLIPREKALDILKSGR